MKTNLIIWFVFLSFVLISCNKETDVITNKSTQTRMSKVITSISYGTNLSTFIWTGIPTENITLKGYTYTKGIIKAQFTSIGKGNYEIEISRIDGTSFQSKGTAYIKAGSVAGSIAGSTSFIASAKSVKVKFNTTFSTGIVNFYPVIVSDNGTRTFTSPLLVFTNPVYTSTASKSTNGTVLGVFNGVDVKSSGGSNLNSSWQCTEFCCRYYSQVYGITIPQISAYLFYTKQPSLRKFANGGNMPPQPGDILVFSGGPSGYGHVMIVTEVISTVVRVAHQNAGNVAPIGYTFNIKNNKLDPTTYVSSFICLGWLRP